MKEIIAYCTKCGHANLYFPKNTKQKNPRMYCDMCKKQFPVGKYLHKTSKKSTPKKNMPIPPQNSIGKGENAPPSQIINDPNELLMSNCIRALNKQDPDVRWATLLVNILKETKQLETKGDVNTLQKLKQYTIKEMINLRKKLIGTSQDVG